MLIEGIQQIARKRDESGSPSLLTIRSHFAAIHLHQYYDFMTARGARLPWAHRTRLQRLHPSLLTTNVSNKSGNLLFAQSYPEQYENVGFVHSWCTVEVHQKSYGVNTSLRQRCASHPPSKGIALLEAPISLRRTSSSLPLTFSGILAGTRFRSLRVNDSRVPSAADTRCRTSQ